MVRLGARLLISRVRRQRAAALLVVLVLATAGAAGTSAVLPRSAVTGPWDRTTASAIREDALAETRRFQVVLGSFAVLLLVAAGFSSPSCSVPASEPSGGSWSCSGSSA